MDPQPDRPFPDLIKCVRSFPQQTVKSWEPLYLAERNHPQVPSTVHGGDVYVLLWDKSQSTLASLFKWAKEAAVPVSDEDARSQGECSV